MGVEEPERSTAANPEEEAAGRLVGQVLSGRYRIDRVLGLGGMGAVYEGEHVLMHRRVAIKVLHPEMTRLPEVVQRFEREAMAAARIDHPNVAVAHDFGRLDDGSFFLVLEFIEGRSLRHVVDEQGALAPRRAAAIARQVLLGLARAHALGIVHRDLKPENVMLVERDGEPLTVKILDFGIAKVSAGEGGGERKATPLTQVGMVFGTPEYMSPEQALGQEVDHRADLYAVGVLLFEMLVGVRPFDAPTAVQLLAVVATRPVPSFAEAAPGRSVPAALEAVTRTLLAKIPADRYVDAKTTLAALDAAMGEQGSDFDAASSRPGLLAHDTIPSPPTEAALAPPPSSVDAGGGAPSMGPMRSIGAMVTDRPGALLPQASVAATTAPQVLGETAMAAPPSHATGGALASGQASPAIARPRAQGGAVVSRWAALEPREKMAVIALSIAVTAAGLWGAWAVVHGGSSTTEGGAIASEGAAPAGAPPRPGATPAPELTDGEVAAAAAEGLTALEALAKKAPRDPRVLRALVKAHSSAGQHVAAVSVIRDLIAATPAAIVDEPAQPALVAAVSSTDAAAVDAAFDLLVSPASGSGGLDVLYQIGMGPKMPTRAQKRANELLLKGDLDDRASPALGATLALRKVIIKGPVEVCKQHRELFARARDDGDARTLVFLQQLTVTKGCGFLRIGDCHPCIRADGLLQQAISAVSARAKAK